MAKQTLTKIFLGLLAVAAIVLAIGAQCTHLFPRKKTLTIIHVNDTHSHFEPVRQEDGSMLGGVIEQKTDNAALFAYSLDSFRENGWEITSVTYDLHRSEYAAENIMTEYEQRFSQLGNKIMRLTAVRPDEVPPVPADPGPHVHSR